MTIASRFTQKTKYHIISTSRFKQMKTYHIILMSNNILGNTKENFSESKRLLTCYLISNYMFRTNLLKRDSLRRYEPGKFTYKYKGDLKTTDYEIS